MSLRARLALLTTAVTVLALVVASVAVWSLVNRFLDDRLDQQLRSLRIAATSALLEGSGPRGVPFGLDATGVYAEARDGSGNLIVGHFLRDPTEPRQQPDLPDTIDPSQIGSTFDVPSTGDGTSVGYRVLVTTPALAGGGATVQGMLVVAIPTTEADATLRRLVVVEVVAGLVVAVLATGLAWWLAGLGLRPLRRIEDTAATIAAGDLSRRVDPGTKATEIVELGSSLNKMLGRIESAFDAKDASEARLRRFVADASHELRTPLTSIRGYAELFRRGAADDPATLSRSMERIEGEAIRMGGLVDDLLLLARLDEGRPMERAPVNLTALAADAVHDAAVADPDRRVELDAPAPVEVEGDRGRLTQVLVNLLANARSHTPRGTPVDVAVRSQNGLAEVSVVDHGPGIPDDQKRLVFDRFHRTDPSRTRDRGGTGLGLAIVDAVVRAHGGSVDVADTPGGGATFIVRLPRSDHSETTASAQGG